MAPLSDLAVTLTPGGREQLRFSATVVNVGAGPLELRVTRPRATRPLAVQQRVYDSAGPPALLATGARMVFAGDGHDHWHVRDLERYALRRLDGTLAGHQLKRGFCFFDTHRYGPRTAATPRRAVYGEARCGGRRSLGLTMGLSVGWGDRYAWSLPDQLVDITGLPPGRYRLLAEVDRGGLFSESDESNNITWVDLRLVRRAGFPSVRILARGPVARPATR